MLKVGLIGCGRIGCGFDDDPERKIISTHAGAYYSFEKTDLVALCDVDKEKLEKYGKKYDVDNLYTDPEKMFEEQDLDIVSICTRESNHHELTILASNAGVRSILCEKPIADTILHAKEMINTCEKNGTILMIDHQRRFQPLYQKIRENINENKLGKIQQSTHYYTAGISNTGSHVIDTLGYFFGDVKWVQAIFSETNSNKPNDPNVDALIKFKNGVLCSLQSLDNSNYLIYEHHIFGTYGRIIIKRNGYGHESFRVDDSDLFLGYKELYENNEPLLKDPLGQPMLHAIENLVDCTLNNKKPLCGGYDGLAVIEIIEKLKNSAKNNGQRIYL